MPSQPVFDGRTSLTAATLNRLMADLRVAENVTATAPLNVMRMGSGPRTLWVDTDEIIANSPIVQTIAANTPAPPTPFWAMITRNTSPGAEFFGPIYSWQRMVPVKWGNWAVDGNGDPSNPSYFAGGTIDRISNKPIRPAFPLNRNFFKQQSGIVLLYPSVFNSDWNTQEYIFDQCCMSPYTQAADFAAFGDVGTCKDISPLKTSGTAVISDCACLNGTSIPLTLTGNHYVGTATLPPYPGLSGSCILSIDFDWDDYVTTTSKNVTLTIVISSASITIGFTIGSPQDTMFRGNQLQITTSSLPNPVEPCCPVQPVGTQGPNPASLCNSSCNPNPTTNPDPPPVNVTRWQPAPVISIQDVYVFSISVTLM